MKVELSQAEIKTAIAAYVAQTIGLDLSKNDLSIEFSATRLQGMIAKLETTPKAQALGGNFDEPFKAEGTVVIPGYSDVTDTTAVDAPALAEPVIDPADAAVEETKAVDLADTVAGETVVSEDANPEPAAEAPKKTTATLFGKPASAA